MTQGVSDFLEFEISVCVFVQVKFGWMVLICCKTEVLLSVIIMIRKES